MAALRSPSFLRDEARARGPFPAAAGCGHRVELSVVIPAHNERGRLGAHLRVLLPHLDALGKSHEVIVVDDGSTDGTAELVRAFSLESPALRLIQLTRNRGKGHAVRTGMLAATGAMRLFTDADGAIPIAELERLAGAIRAGADVAIGSKQAPRGRFARRVARRVFNIVVRMLVAPGVRDTQCGFKLFDAEAADQLFAEQTLDGFCFDVELLFLARRHGYRVSELPVEWSDVSGGRIQVVRDSLRMTWDLLRIRWRSLRGRYGRSRGGDDGS